MKMVDKCWTKELEEQIFSRWRDENVFKFDPNLKKKVYSIDTPPPYVNMPVHIGHATTYVLMDMFARFKRMSGYEILFPFCLDRNGLPIEISAESEFKVDFTKISREEAIDYCKKLLDKYSIESVDSFYRSGISFSSWKVGNNLGDIYETDSPEYRAMTQKIFVELYKKGLIYEDAKVTNWDPKLQTAISDSEIVYENKPGFFYNIVFKIKETGEEIIIGTTRPELVCTCGMVIFNPDDERYKNLLGLTAITPVFNKEVPIKAHPSAEINKGTGLVMMCAFGDLTDIRFFIEQGLSWNVAINKDGLMNENAGILQGLDIKSARAKLVDEMKSKNLVREIIPTSSHRTPISDRSGAEVEFIEMQEFYLKQIEFKDDLRKIADKINFFAPDSKKILLDWIDTVSIDWPISRRRFYATEVPLWKCQDCGEVIFDEVGKYVQPWKQPSPISNCPKCNSSNIKGDVRVLDTWFDSSNSPLYVLGYDYHKDFFKSHSPCVLRPQGKEIVRTWLYYTLLKGFLLENAPIFQDVWIHHHILDGKGYKMSKSKGNGIDPHDILEKFGAEPFRLWAVLEGNLVSTDFKCDYDRIEGATKYITKLWNIARFVSNFEYSNQEYELTDLDKLVLMEINDIISYTISCYENYDFHNPVVRIYNFTRDLFASHYLELVKSRAYNSENKFSEKLQAGALFTLNYCLERILYLLAPVNPMFSEFVSEKLFGKNPNLDSFPKADSSFSSSLNKDDLMEFNSLIWKIKKDANLSLKSDVASAVAPKSLENISLDLKAMHHIKDLSFGDSSSASLK